MKIFGLYHIALYLAFFILSHDIYAQECQKDSNFYSITFRGLDRNQIKFATPVSESEVITLSRHSSFSDFVTKFSSQGQVIWSNEYIPDYPFDYWWQYPWYERTTMEGMITAIDSTCYLYGSTIEHGTTLNGAGPPTHQAGLVLHLDKFGNLISGKYLGNWLTDYSVNSLVRLANGNLVAYLRSHFFPYTSKLVCFNASGNVLWGTPLQTEFLYSEVDAVNPVMKQLSNGNIIVVNEMQRNLDDTLFYPFLAPIIVPAPLIYFHLFSVNGNNGKLIEEFSYQCPPLKNTNAPAAFIPQVKSITELADGKLSLFADMYLPVDSVIFFKQKVYSRSIVNIITNLDGGFLKQIFYRPANNAAVLQNVHSTGNNGEQLILAVDSAYQQPILFKIGNDQQVLWSKTYANLLASGNLSGIAIKKKNKNGYFIFQTDPDQINFHLSVTNASGNNTCTEIPGPAMVATPFSWPWSANKIHFNSVPFNMDFRISSFNFIKKPHPLTQQIDCQYQNTCCTDFIDSLHPHDISICEGRTYTLPDNTIVKKSGNYYAIKKTAAGCDSIQYYNLKVLKSPSQLAVSADTCLNGNSVIRLRASEGYETYWWNNVAGSNPFTVVQAPGTYNVRVENQCGTKTETITVYDNCDFPIYFPGAFTPNGDFLNDILNVPALNKNKLRHLTIYNRWGQIIFSTRTKDVGWDGKFKDVPQPADIYVYILEMEGLSGKRISQKGTVALIR